jgi:hypothetical protein
MHDSTPDNKLCHIYPSNGLSISFIRFEYTRALCTLSEHGVVSGNTIKWKRRQAVTFSTDSSH